MYNTSLYGHLQQIHLQRPSLYRPPKFKPFAAKQLAAKFEQLAAILSAAGHLKQNCSVQTMPLQMDLLQVVGLQVAKV